MNVFGFGGSLGGVGGGIGEGIGDGPGGREPFLLTAFFPFLNLPLWIAIIIHPPAVAF
jgi:hypothetical protein